jgi:hypothetical protein
MIPTYTPHPVTRTPPIPPIPQIRKARHPHPPPRSLLEPLNDPPNTAYAPSSRTAQPSRNTAITHPARTQSRPQNRSAHRTRSAQSLPLSRRHSTGINAASKRLHQRGPSGRQLCRGLGGGIEWSRRTARFDRASCELRALDLDMDMDIDLGMKMEIESYNSI